MAKQLLQLPDDAIQILPQHPETGMGFYVIKGHFPKAYVDNVFIIAGDHYLVPLRHAEFFSVADLIEGRPLPRNAETAEGFVITSSSSSRHAASLPSGYKPTAECVPVFAAATLPEATVLGRYLGAETDPRLVDSRLVPGSILTTRLNRNDVQTGFAATSRYGLPLPSPACHVFEYEIPSGTQVIIGTVLPCFGQVGGGIEIRLTAATAVTPCGQQRLGEF